jgi:hypothetical protein
MAFLDHPTLQPGDRTLRFLQTAPDAFVVYPYHIGTQDSRKLALPEPKEWMLDADTGETQFK